MTVPFRLKQQQRSRRHWRRLIGAHIGVILLAHGFAFLDLPPPGLWENRRLAQFPAMPETIGDILALPEKLNKYVADNFPPRGQMIAGLNILRYKLGYSGFKRVVIGQDGWLFRNDKFRTPYIRGGARFSSARLDAWAKETQRRAAIHAQAGVAYYQLIVPSKNIVYAERMPDYLRVRPGDITVMDQIMAAAEQNDLDFIIDLRAAMQKAKAQTGDFLYSPYDTHWNGFGAYVAYVELLNRINRDYPDLAPLPIEQFRIVVPGPKETPTSLSDMLGISNIVPKYYPQLEHPYYHATRIEYLTEQHDPAAAQIIYTNAGTGRTLLLIRDSFNLVFVPLLMPHFDKIISVHIVDAPIRPELLRQYRPDIAILQMVDVRLVRHYGDKPEAEPDDN